MNTKSVTSVEGGGPYRVVVVGPEGDYLSDTEVDTLREAKEEARVKLTVADEYLNSGAVKSEVFNADGVCVYDRFVKAVRA